jgi:hypothetical protein
VEADVEVHAGGAWTLRAPADRTLQGRRRARQFFPGGHHLDALRGHAEHAIQTVYAASTRSEARRSRRRGFRDELERRSSSPSRASVSEAARRTDAREDDAAGPLAAIAQRVPRVLQVARDRDLRSCHLLET